MPAVWMTNALYCLLQSFWKSCCHHSRDMETFGSRLGLCGIIKLVSVEVDSKLSLSLDASVCALNYYAMVFSLHPLFSPPLLKLSSLLGTNFDGKQTTENHSRFFLLFCMQSIMRSFNLLSQKFLTLPLNLLLPVRLSDPKFKLSFIISLMHFSISLPMILLLFLCSSKSHHSPNKLSSTKA